MKKLPKISIVMSVFIGMKYLKDTIKPLLNLDYPDYEIIIVDNKSSDKSKEYIISLKKIYKKIKLVSALDYFSKNYACNKGVLNSKGEFILLMDQDVIITEKGILKKLLQRYSNNTGVIALSTREKENDYSQNTGGYLSFYFILNNKKIKLKDLKSTDKSLIANPCGQALFISKSKWNEVGGYDEYLSFGGDDTDLGLKLCIKGYSNYQYSRTCQIHLGIEERRNTKRYIYKFKNEFYSNLYTIVKDYTIFNMFSSLFFYSIYAFLKSIKQSFSRLNIGVFIAYFKGYFMFIKSLPHAIKMRKIVQSYRKVKEDVFLNIKPKHL